MVGGYPLGRLIPEVGRFTALDSDRHGWSQAYFPGYGWIDVESTLGYNVNARGEELPLVDRYDVALTTGELFEAEFYTEDEDLAGQSALAGQLALARDLRDQARGDSSVAALAIPAGVVATACSSRWCFGIGAQAASPWPKERTRRCCA